MAKVHASLKHVSSRVPTCIYFTFTHICFHACFRKLHRQAPPFTICNITNRSMGKLRGGNTRLHAFGIFALISKVLPWVVHLYSLCCLYTLVSLQHYLTALHSTPVAMSTCRDSRIQIYPCRAGPVDGESRAQKTSCTTKPLHPCTAHSSHQRWR